MKKFVVSMAILASSSVFALNAQAQVFKVGYVSLDRLVAESGVAKASRTELENQFKSREKSLDAKSAQIRNKQQAYEKDFPTLSNAQKEAREKSLTQEIEAFETERAKFESDLSAAQNQLLQSLLAKADSLIKNIAEKEGYDLIVQDAVYIKPQYDLTSRVLENLR
ncbi:MAG: OmpH family outer membrane protein [Formosimonas sp.]